MTGISVDLETMAKAIYEFSGLAKVVQEAVDQLEGTINEFTGGSEVVSQCWTALYAFAASWFEQALDSHKDVLQFASDSVKSWADQITSTDTELADGFQKAMQIIEQEG